MSITDHIQYLISRHDCVVVAGLGAFVAQYEPARLSANGSMLLPPCRTLVFNAMVRHDDGLLVGSVARREGLSYDAARDAVANDVEFLLRRIEMEGSVELPRIGRLERNSGASLVFVPDSGKDAVVNAMYAAMPALALSSAVPQEHAEEPRILEVDVTRNFGDRILRGLKPVAKYAAAVAVLLAVGATLTTPALIDRRMVDQASLSIPEVKPAKTIVINTPQTAKRPVAEAAKADVKAPEVIRVADLKTDGESYKCFVIVASCASRSEAERFIRMKKGEGTMNVLKSDGRYRIYTAVSNDYDAAFKFKSSDPETTSSHPQAWVYSRK